MKRIPILVWNHPLSMLSAPPRKSPLSSKMLPRLYPFFKNNRKEPLGENQKAKKLQTICKLRWALKKMGRVIWKKS